MAAKQIKEHISKEEKIGYGINITKY